MALRSSRCARLLLAVACLVTFTFPSPGVVMGSSAKPRPTVPPHPRTLLRRSVEQSAVDRDRPLTLQHSSRTPVAEAAGVIQPVDLLIPTFAVRPGDDSVAGWDWLPDSSVHVAIDDLDADTDPDFEFDAATDAFNWFEELDIGYDIQAGFTVTVTQGATTKTHVVTELEVTGVDTGSSIVTGTAEPGSEVWVTAFANEPRPDPSRVVTASAEGTWTADFSVAGDTGDPDEERIWTFGPGDFGVAFQPDIDGDSTEAGWHIPDPSFIVRPAEDSVGGWDWLDGDSVHVAIDDLDADTDPDFEFDAPVVFGEFDEWDIAYDIQAGFTVTVTQGTTTKTHVVTELEVTGVDRGSSIVTGTAEPGSEVEVTAFANEPRPDPKRVVTADGGGTWTADFSALGDTGDPDEERIWIMEADGSGVAAQPDVDGDSTEAGWQIPNPSFAVNPAEDGVGGWDWLDGDSVHVAIDDLDADTNPDFQFDAPVEFGEFDEWDIAYDIQAGFTVTVTQGTTTKTHVVTELEVTGVDMGSSIVTGTAEPGARVQVTAFAEEPRPDPSRVVTASAEGTWTADFSVLGDTGDPDEERIWTFGPGDFGVAFQPDIDGDSTEAGWQVPDPSFVVRPAQDSVGGWDWLAGDSVHVAIDDLDADTDPDFEFDPPVVFGEFDEWDIAYDIQAGFTVTVTQGTTTKTHVVTELEVTGVDAGSSIVTGTAEPGSEVEVIVFANEPRPDPRRVVTASAEGTWTADFSAAGDTGDPDEERTWTFGPGDFGVAYQPDIDGDATEAGWEVPNQAPVAVADPNYTTVRGTALNVVAPGVLANDTDAEGDPLTASQVMAPVHGALVLQANGAFLYTPEPTFIGTDSFTYVANDGTSDSNTVAVSINVTPVMKSVYRFYNRLNGSHFYTASVAERDRVRTELAAVYTYEGTAYRINADNAANCEALYRFYNVQNGSHFYTASVAERDRVRRELSMIYSYDGPAYNVCTAPPGGSTTVYRFYNMQNGSHFYTASLKEKNDVLRDLSTVYNLDGPAFFLAP